jgi:hypothetical protein
MFPTLHVAWTPTCHHTQAGLRIAHSLQALIKQTMDKANEKYTTVHLRVPNA